MAPKTEMLPPLDIAREQSVITNAIGALKGPVESFVPIDGAQLQKLVLATKRLPEGIFANCRMFDSEHYPDFATQLAMRRDAVRAEAVVTTPAQDEIYGKLDGETAAIALDMIKARISSEEYRGEKILSTDTRQAWHDFLHAKFDPVFERVYNEFDDGQEIIGGHLVEMIRAFMRESGLPMAKHMDDHDGWDVIYDEKKSGFNVESATKRVICGTRDKALTQLDFEKLMIHEIIRHAWTAENGSRTGYRALQTGLPGFNEPEEGGGILFEAFWSGEDPMQLGRDHFRYVATAYADGLYDGVKHSEQETFDYIDNLMQQAGIRDDAELYRHVLRPFRGMPDGCRMRSNATYLAGKIDVMRDIEAQFRAGVPVEETFTAYTEAKINPFDPKQVVLKKKAMRQAA